MITWPRDLIVDIARRKSVLYLGAGISANSVDRNGSHPATWKIFLENILSNKRELFSDETRKLIESLLQKEDFLTSCEIIVNVITPHIFGEEAANTFRRPGFSPHEIHKKIFDLDSRIVISPNIDKIYDQYVLNESQGTIITKNYYDSDIATALRSSDYLLIKAHGTIDSPDKIVFTRSQYCRARYEYAAFYKLLDALVLTHTFIFLGCGIDDPDIQLVLENYNFTFPCCRHHYFITSNDSQAAKLKDSLKQNRNIEIITYENTTGDHYDLLCSLENLCTIVEQEREEISKLTSW